MIKRKRLDNIRAGFIWNSVAGLINAAEAVIILMVVTRVSGLEMAGMITIAFSVGNLMMTVGKYGMRNFQVTDVNNVFSFNDYLSSRIVTVAAMFILTLLYLSYAIICLNYSWQKVTIVFLICLIYMIESVEDVYWGDYQKYGHLDYGGKVFSYRWLIQLAIIIIILVLTNNAICALLSACVCGAAFTYVYNKQKHIAFQNERVCFRSRNIISILSCCFPLFLTVFLSNYIVNSPKYAIDAILDEESQACYGFVAMPVFVVALLSNFFYQPILLDLANIWEKRQFKNLTAMIKKQCALIFALAIICVVGAYFCGIPCLNILYGTDLSAQKTELLILLCGGGFLALGSLCIVIMTTLRIQFKAIWVYGIVALLAFGFSKIVVRCYGITGAACLYTLMEALTAFLLWFFTISYIKSEADKYKNKLIERERLEVQ